MKWIQAVFYSFLLQKSRYKAIPVDNYDNSNVIDRIATDNMIKAKLYEKVRLRFSDKSIIEEISDDLKNGRVYSLNLNDSRVNIYDEFLHITAGKEILNVISFDKNKFGKESITKTSLGLIVKVS